MIHCRSILTIKPSLVFVHGKQAVFPLLSNSHLISLNRFLNSHCSQEDLLCESLQKSRVDCSKVIIDHKVHAHMVATDLRLSIPYQNPIRIHYSVFFKYLSGVSVDDDFFNFFHRKQGVEYQRNKGLPAKFLKFFPFTLAIAFIVEVLQSCKNMT